MSSTIRTITAIIGVVLVVLGLYQAFVPQEVLGIGDFKINAKEGFTSETIALILIGVVALIASIYKRK